MFGRSKMGMESLSEVGCAARGMAGSPVSEGSKRPRGCIRGMNCRMVGNLSVVFFFSSRRRHTRWNCDWGSDVCSSDLRPRGRIRSDSALRRRKAPTLTFMTPFHLTAFLPELVLLLGALVIFFTTLGKSRVEEARIAARSEKRRVGKECRSRWSPYH